MKESGVISFLFFNFLILNALLFVFCVRFEMKQLSYIILSDTVALSGHLKRHLALSIVHGKF